MKANLATVIVIGVVGTIVAYFVTNMIIPSVGEFTYTSVDSSIGADYIEPDIELFNYRALNPTVEVYVGSCTEYDENGECLDDALYQEDTDVSDDDIVKPDESTEK